MGDQRIGDGTNRPISSLDELEALFHSGAKPREAWKVGIEYEKPVVLTSSGESVAYEGPSGIRALLEAMLQQDPSWSPVHEGENLIALRDGRASITLEPGGQLEMSGQQCDSLHCADDELDRHIREIVTAGQHLGLSFLGIGAVPKTPLGRAPWMPKQRYRIMREVMKSTGRLGHRMMQQTATVQCNFDYSDEADAARKFRLSMALSPLLVAMAANSPVIDGGPTGYKSYRGHIWSDTDPARCGILPFAFTTENLFGAYTRYALDVPMYFLSRGDRLLPLRAMTFRRFLTEGFGAERATFADWQLHLTTLFPEVRLKTYIEVRSADSQPVELMLGTPALVKGLLYDDDCLEASWDVLRHWSIEERLALQEDAARNGLQARAGRYPLQELATELATIAREGLHRQSRTSRHGDDESIYLERLAEQIDAGRCPADGLIEHWQGDWHGDVDRLIQYATYRPRH